MSGSSPPGKDGPTPVDGKADLIAYMEAGCKPREAWRIGTEHEKFAFRPSDLRPLAYADTPGIRDVLMALAHYGWQPVYEGENVVALTGGKGDSITLEPGRPGGAVGRGGGDHPSDLRRSAGAPAPGPRRRQEAGHRHDGHGLQPEMGARGRAMDAEGALRHHAPPTCRPRAHTGST